MASLSELASIMQTGPAESFRSADIGYQQYQLQQQAIQQAQQDQAQQAKPQGLPGMAGAPAGGKPQAGLGQMAGSLLGPQFKLTTPDGELTSAGLINQTMMTAQTESQQAQKALKEANYYDAMGKPELAMQSKMEARRLMDKAQQTQLSAQKQKTAAKDDFASTLYGAKSQEDYDRRLKDVLERTGIEPPKEMPTTWSPDMKEKLLSKMSPETRAKIEKQERDESYRKLQEQNLRLNINRKEAKYRDGVGGGADAKDIKKLGPAIRKIGTEFGTDLGDLTGIDAKEKGQARAAYVSLNRVEELASFIDQHPDAVGTLAAVTKKFGSKTENFIDNLQKDEVSGNLTGDAAVLSKMLTQQALDDVTASVGGRVNQMLEKTFMNQIYDQSLSADTLKRVLASRQHEAGKVLGDIGVDVDNAKDKGKYKFYFSNYEKSREGGAKPAETKPEAKPSEAKPSTAKAMPDAPKLKAYADAHFGGDVTKAKSYLSTQGYKD